MLLTQSQLSIADSLFGYVEKLTGKTQTEIASTSREQKLVYSRIAICHALRECGWTYSAIGKVLNRDHSTIIHSLRTYAKIQFTSEYGNSYDERQVIDIANSLLVYLTTSKQSERIKDEARLSAAVAMQNNGSSLLSIIGVCR